MNNRKVKIENISDEFSIYWIGEQRFEIVPASSERRWINETNKAAYKCRPLREASCLGWQILSPCDINMKWDGGIDKKSVSINCSDNKVSDLITSHFGFGLVSFVISAIFRTPPNTDLILQGPTNSPKEGISPLSAKIETDWLPFYFAMTWKFTAPNTQIIFQHGEPFAQFFLISREFSPKKTIKHKSVFESEAIFEHYMQYRAKREMDASKYLLNQTYQRPLGFYERGEYADGTPAVDYKRRLITDQDEQD